MVRFVSHDCLSALKQRDFPENLLETVCLIVALGQVAAVAVWIIRQPYPSLQDYLHWAYMGHIFAALIKGDPIATEAFGFTPHPVPNTVAQLILGLLNLVLSPLAAARAVILAYLVFFTTLIVLLTRRVTQRHWRKLTLLFMSCAVLNSSFWNGYIAYQLSLFFLAVFLYLWIVKGSRSAPLICLFSILMFFTHAATFLIFCLFVGFSELTRSPERLVILPRPATIAAFVPVFLLTIWYIFARVAFVTHMGRVHGDSIFQILAYKYYTLMKLGPFHLFQTPDSTWFVAPDGYLFWIGVVINGVWAGLLIGGILWALMIRCRDSMGLRQGVMLIGFSAISFVMFLVTPPVWGGIVNLGERIFNAAVVVILLTAMLPTSILRGLVLTTLAGTVYSFCFLVDPYSLAPEDVSERSSASDRASDLFFTHRLHQFDDYGAFLRDPAGLPPKAITFESSIILMKE
jgi:hypothetical protein